MFSMRSRSSLRNKKIFSPHPSVQARFPRFSLDYLYLTDSKSNSAAKSYLSTSIKGISRQLITPANFRHFLHLYLWKFIEDDLTAFLEVSESIDFPQTKDAI